MEALAAAIPGIRGIFAPDRVGNVIATNRKEPENQNFAYREYFKTPCNKKIDQLYLLRPFRTITGIYSIKVTKPVFNANGESDGTGDARSRFFYDRAAFYSLYMEGSGRRQKNRW